MFVVASFVVIGFTMSTDIVAVIVAVVAADIVVMVVDVVAASDTAIDVVFDAVVVFYDKC